MLHDSNIKPCKQDHEKMAGNDIIIIRQNLFMASCLSSLSALKSSKQHSFSTDETGVYGWLHIAAKMNFGI
jgi:hypothetical protein